MGYKITKAQWDKLDDFYMLVNMGFRPKGDSLDVYEESGRILSEGWEE